MDKLKLIQLRQENCGYNLENADDIGKVDQVDNFTLYITDFSGDHTTVFYKDEIDFIETYPKTYGIIYKGEIYLQSEM